MACVVCLLGFVGYCCVTCVGWRFYCSVLLGGVLCCVMLWVVSCVLCEVCSWCVVRCVLLLLLVVLLVVCYLSCCCVDRVVPLPLCSCCVLIWRRAFLVVRGWLLMCCRVLLLGVCGGVWLVGRCVVRACCWLLVVDCLLIIGWRVLFVCWGLLVIVV